MTAIREAASFALGDALLASGFADLAYNHRDSADFRRRTLATGWQGLHVPAERMGANSHAPEPGGYGVRDGLTMQSFAYAAKRVAGDGSHQFIVAFEGSNNPLTEPADWIINAGAYGWSRYYASVKPLLEQVVHEVLEVQRLGQQAQLILTGHSLGGAAALMAFADLVAPRGNLWPEGGPALRAGERLLDAIGDWSDVTRQKLLEATTVYTYGAPSILIEPGKLRDGEVQDFLASLPFRDPTLSAIALLARTIGALTVEEAKVPNLVGVGGVRFVDRVFQFEHANSSFLYPGDVVAQLGSRDPGTVLEINLDDTIHKRYTSLLTRFLPGGTHPMGSYQESLIRLVAQEPVLKQPNPLTGTSPALTPTASGTGSDGRNDLFRNSSDAGRGGHDLFAYDAAGAYTASGDLGNDVYLVGGYGIALTIDGLRQSGRDSLLFNLDGTQRVDYVNLDADPDAEQAVFSISNGAGLSSSVTIDGWDQWQLSDVFQVNKPAEGRWTLQRWETLPHASTRPEEVTEPVSAPYVRVLVTVAPRGSAHADRDLDINALLALLADPAQRASFVTETILEPTVSGGATARRGSSRFFRIGRNRFAADSTVATGAASEDPAALVAFLQTLLGEATARFQRVQTTVTVEPDRQTVAVGLPAASSADTSVGLLASLQARSETVTTLGFLVLEAGESAATVTDSTLRQRGVTLLSSLENQDTPAALAELDLSTRMELKPGQRLLFFEVLDGAAVASAGDFRLLQAEQQGSQRIRLRSSRGLVVDLSADAGASEPGMAAYAARDQAEAPVLNLRGLRPTDRVTGEAVLAREATYNTDGGFYVIEDLTGAVRDPISGTRIAPGDPGYGEAALRRSVGRLSELRVSDDQSLVRTFTLEAEALNLLAPFATVHEAFTTRVYFGFAAANPDKRDHIRMLGDNTFGLEDAFGGGDGDFDDLVVSLRKLVLT